MIKKTLSDLKNFGLCLRFSLLLVLFNPVISASQQPYKLVVCAVFQNETFFLKEWLDFHKSMGVEHFYLYNNLSSDNYLEVLAPYIAAGEVELVDIPAETCNQQEYLDLLQLPAYNDGLTKAKISSQWAAFLDLDEFLFPVRHDSLTDMLADYENYGGIAVNWQIYGTSWLDELPAGSMLTECLLMKAPTDADINRTVKLIVQPSKVIAIKNPHYFEFAEGWCAVDSLGIPVERDCEIKPVLVDAIRINHYWFGTRCFFEKEKIPRREKWGFCLDKKTQDHLISSCNQVSDDAILRHIQTLKQRSEQ